MMSNLKHSILAPLVFVAFFAFGADKFTQVPTRDKVTDRDLTFAVTFDKYDVNGDFAKGDAYSRNMRECNLMLRMLSGFDGGGAYEAKPGENLRFNVLGNARAQEGTLSLWLKSERYQPGTALTDGRNRGNLAFAHIVFGEDALWQEGNTPDVDSISGNPKGKRMLDLRLYEYADNIYFDWRSSEEPHTYGNDVGRANLSPRGIACGEWYQIVCTWGRKGLAMYVNGELGFQGALPDKYSKTDDFELKSGFIGILSSYYGDGHSWGVCVDDVKVYSRALTALQVKNAYLALLKDQTAVKLEDFEMSITGVDRGTRESIDTLEAEFDFTALPVEYARRLKEGKLEMQYVLRLPDGSLRQGVWTFSRKVEQRFFEGITLPGEYVLEASIPGRDKVTSRISRPDLSFAYNGIGDEDEVPEIWRDFRFEGRRVTLWNRTYTFGEGPLPIDISVGGRKLLTSAPALFLDGAPVENWRAGATRHTNRTVTFTGEGSFKGMKIEYATTVEFDGMIAFEWTINGRRKIKSMQLKWALAKDFCKFLLTPELDSGKEEKVAFRHEIGKDMLWFAAPKIGGFAFGIDDDANWVLAEGKPTFFANRRTGRCRAEIIQSAVAMPGQASYKALFIATPTRPLPRKNRAVEFGSKLFLLHADGCGGFTGPGGFEPHETDFTARVADARPGSLSVYGLANALTENYPCVQYFGKYWSIPHGAICNMPWERPLGDGKYEKLFFPLKLYCNTTCMQDFQLNNQMKIYEHPYGDRIFQIYYDHCGAGDCRNKLHGCLFKDSFGREIARSELLSKRRLIKRTVALAHRMGRTVMCHGQRSFYPFQCGLADYWFPGEQHYSQVRRNVWCFTDEVPDELYQSEYNRDVLGVGVIFLTSIWYANQGEYCRTPEPTEALLSMLGLNDIEATPMFANGEVFKRYWAILEKYGVDAQETECFKYYEDNTVKSSSPKLRVTWYKCPEGRYVLFISNKEQEEQSGVIDISALAAGTFTASEEYFNAKVPVVEGKFTVSIPKRSFKIVAFPAKGFYPHYDGLDFRWDTWQPAGGDTIFGMEYREQLASEGCFRAELNQKGEGSYHKACPVRSGKTYRFSVMAKQTSGGTGVKIGIQALKDRKFLELPPVVSESQCLGKWTEVVLEYTVPSAGPWAEADMVLVTLNVMGSNCETYFDEFHATEK